MEIQKLPYKIRINIILNFSEIIQFFETSTKTYSHFGLDLTLFSLDKFTSFQKTCFYPTEKRV